MALISEFLSGIYLPFMVVVLLVGIVSIGVALYLTFKIKALPEGTPEMKQISTYIKEGAKAYLKRQYKTIIIIGAIITVGLALGIDYATHWRMVNSL